MVTTAFVLSGGASLGAVQVGMLQALAEHDVWPDVIVGTSVGALNGAHLAGNSRQPASTSSLACGGHCAAATSSRSARGPRSGA